MARWHLENERKVLVISMVFDSFESAVTGYKSFLAEKKLPTDLLWLVRSRVRCKGNAFYVFRPSELTDFSEHEKRFNLALKLNKNIVFSFYAHHNGHSVIGLQTAGLDRPQTDFDESGSHKYQLLPDPPQFKPVESTLMWRLAGFFIKDSSTLADYGWPQ